jgi:hypothetical protein
LRYKLAPRLRHLLPSIGSVCSADDDLKQGADAFEDALKQQFGGVDVVLDYLWGPSAERIIIAGAKAGKDALRKTFVTHRPRFGLPYPSNIGSNTPNPNANSHSAGAGVPTGRVRRSSRAAALGSSISHRM